MSTDHNLLFGILALQLDFIERDQLIQAMHAWILDKTKSLGQILAEQGVLQPQRRTLIDSLVKEHLHVHDNDTPKSIEALHVTLDLRNTLLELSDPDVYDTLTRIPDGREAAIGTVDFPRSPSGERYSILRHHAKGGIGEVFVALDKELNREVALKEIQTQRVRDLPSRARFLLEAEITAGLEHPGVIPIYGLGNHPDGRPYYAMRFIRGDSLLQSLRRFHADQEIGARATERSLALRGLLRRFVDVCNAIAYAHSRGVLHRDIKPGNIMLGKYGETLVVDWGLAKAMGQVEEADEADTAGPLVPSSGSGYTPTAAGAALGTWGYMAPEQAAGRLNDLGVTSDIYSLGATLYHLLVGRPSLGSNALKEVDHRIQDWNILSARQVNPAVPAALDAICQKAMALCPIDRYQTALELADDVEHWLADEPVAAYPDPLTIRISRWSRRHRTGLVAAAVLLVSTVAALSVTTGLVWRKEQEVVQEKRIALENYDIAKTLSFGGIELIKLSEADIASVPALHSARREVLQGAARAFRKYLEQDPNDPDLQRRTAEVYRYTANVQNFSNDTKQADGLYRDSIRLQEKLAEHSQDDPQYRMSLADTLRDYSQLQAKVGQLRGANDSLAQAVELAEGLHSENQNHSACCRSLAIALIDLSGVEHAMGKTFESGRTASRAAKLLTAIPVGEAMPYDPLLVAHSYNRVAMAERDNDWIEIAEPFHVKADRLLAEMGKKQPPGVNQADVQFFRAWCKVEQSRTRSLTPARPVAERDLGLAALQFERLAQNHKEVPAYREWHGLALFYRASLRAEDDRADEALEDLKSCQQIFDQLVRDFPALPGNIENLGRSYLGLGRINRQKGDVAESASCFEKAARLLAVAADQSPDNADVIRFLKEARTELDRSESGRQAKTPLS